MAEPALPPLADPMLVRRFQLADMNRHGGWIMTRLRKVYPHLTEPVAYGWLRGLIASNEFLFLTAEHGVALFGLDRAHTLSPKPLIQEHFVLAEEGHQEAAGAFYEEAERWAVSLGADTIVIDVITDVPLAEIKKRVKRVFEKMQRFAKVG